MESPHAPAHRALVLDDDANAAFIIGEALRLSGFEVATAERAGEALDQAEDPGFDVIVVEADLPHIDGFAVCERLRRAGSEVPVVFVSRSDSLADRLRAFSLGADDFVPKPLHVQELVARVLAVLRRTAHQDDDVLRLGTLELDQRAHRVMVEGRSVPLSPHEYELLRMLLLHRGQALSRGQLLDRIWGYDFVGGPSVIETRVSSLRRKLGRSGADLIHTVRGIGYRIDPPELTN